MVTVCMQAFVASACTGQERVLTWWSGSDGPDDPAGYGQNGFGGIDRPCERTRSDFRVLRAGSARSEGWEIRYEESDIGDRGVSDIECLRRSWRMHCRPCGDHRSARNVDGSSAEAEFSGLCLGRHPEIQGLVRSLAGAARDAPDLRYGRSRARPFRGSSRRTPTTTHRNPTSLDLDRGLV